MNVIKYGDKAIVVKNENGEKKLLSSRAFEPTNTKAITSTEVTDVRNFSKAIVVDENLKPGNIKKGVTILGIEGTYEGE